MKASHRIDKKKDHGITEFGITSDTLTFRGGMGSPELWEALGKMLKSAKDKLGQRQ